MKTNHRLLKHALLTMSAIPIGAVSAMVCEVAIRAFPMLFRALTDRAGTQDIFSFLGFDLLLMAYSAVPIGSVVLPLTYLIFFRHVLLNQMFQIIGCLMLGTIVIGIPGSILFHSLIPAILGFFLGVFYVRRKFPPDQKPARLKMIFGFIAIFALALIMPEFTLVVGMLWSLHGISGVERRMKSPRTYEVFDTNLALYCQSISSLNLTDNVSSAYLPQPIPQLNNQAWAQFRPDFAFIEFGGGFYHYGYDLRLAANASTPYTNFWELYFRSEGSTDSLLASFTVPSSARMPLATFENSILSEYSRRIAADPADLNFHKGRIRFLLNYKPDQVRQACLDAIKDIPNAWWPRLTLAIWDSGHGKFTEASKNFVIFAESKPSYSHYIYLAWFYQTIDHPDEAAAAIEKAIQYPIVDASDDDCNTECRGYTVGVSAYQSGKYDAVIKLCDVLLPVRINGDYAKSGLNALRDSAEAGRSGSTRPFQPDGNILFFNPYENMNLASLLGK